jgi:hypothetical protein
MDKDRKASIRYRRTGHLWITVIAKSTKTKTRIALTNLVYPIELQRFSADGQSL